MKKRIFAVVLSVALLLGSLSVVSFAEPEATDTVSPLIATAVDAPSVDGGLPQEIVKAAPYEEGVKFDEEEGIFTVRYQKQIENERFAFYMDEKTTFFLVYDKQTGAQWESNPVVENGGSVSGEAINNVRSQLIIHYYNSSLQLKKVYSYAASVKKGKFTIGKQTNAIRVDYLFEEQKMTIPVQYTLSEEGLLAELLFSEIKNEDENNSLSYVDFLPYFSAGSRQDNGYMLVPDGSGAIIRFNNQKGVTKNVSSNSIIDSSVDSDVANYNYSKDFYEKDPVASTTSNVVTSRSEKISLPVYGMVKNGYGWLAEVVSGAEAGTLNAFVSDNVTTAGPYNIVYTTSSYHVAYKVPVMDQLSNATAVTFMAQELTGVDKYSVMYRFCEKQNANYIDLASMYQKALLQSGVLSKDTIRDDFYVQFYGAVNKKKSFAGFPYTARETLTSFEDAEHILSDLKDGGVVNINAMYTAFSDDFFNRKIEIALNPSGSLGGTKAMDHLLGFVRGQNMNMALAANFIKLPTGGNGFSTFFDVADTINIEAAKIWGTSLNGNGKNASIPPFYYVTGEKYENGVKKLQESAEKYGYTSLFFDKDATTLYSDYAPKKQQRFATSASMQAAMQTLSQKATLTMSNPNAYLYRYVTTLVDIPTCSSKSILFDQDVPFLQAVLKGIKNFAGESVNITDSSKEGFLKLLEYGSGMKYSLINSNTEVLLNTDMTFLYSATYTVFKEQIRERYADYKAVCAVVGDATMVDHQVADNTAVTTYSNGARVYVNYNEIDVVIDGVLVPAIGYTVTE